MTPAPVATTEAPATSETAPTPSPEEIEAEAERQKLAADFAKLQADHQAELARLTPEVRAAAAKVADTSFWTTRSAMAATLTSPHRRPGNPERDVHRHPKETLEFLGLVPNQTVLEVGPGEGWYTEVLAPTLAKRGQLFVTTSDPMAPQDQRPTLYAQRTKLFLEALPEAYGKVKPLVLDPKDPKLALEDKQLDMVFLVRGMQGMVNNGVLESWLREFHRTLKPKGLLAVVQHRAAPGADPAASAKQGYLPEAFVIEQVEKLGFKLDAKSEVNANPKDTKDYADGVWTLPPSLRLGEQDKEKYLAIGESDRMTLKFVRSVKPLPPVESDAPVAAPAAAAPAAAAPAAAAPAAAAPPAPPAAAPAAAAPAAAPAATPAPAAPAAP